MDTTLCESANEPAIDLFGRELAEDELELVCGTGSTRRQVGYSTSLTTSLMLLGGALVVIGAAPVVAGALALGSIGASATAIYWSRG